MNENVIIGTDLVAIEMHFVYTADGLLTHDTHLVGYVSGRVDGELHLLPRKRRVNAPLYRAARTVLYGLTYYQGLDVDSRTEISS
jgi:hypothetical protein